MKIPSNLRVHWSVHKLHDSGIDRGVQPFHLGPAITRLGGGRQMSPSLPCGTGQSTIPTSEASEIAVCTFVFAGSRGEDAWLQSSPTTIWHYCTRKVDWTA